jgi:hypothetical protein
MNNIKRVNCKVTEEEIEKIKSLDWATYYKSFPNMDESIRSCPKCDVMIFPQQGDTEFICKRCGEKILL